MIKKDETADLSHLCPPMFLSVLIHCHFVKNKIEKIKNGLHVSTSKVLLSKNRISVDMSVYSVPQSSTALVSDMSAIH